MAIAKWERMALYTPGDLFSYIDVNRKGEQTRVQMPFAGLFSISTADTSYKSSFGDEFTFKLVGDTFSCRYNFNIDNADRISMSPNEIAIRQRHSAELESLNAQKNIIESIFAPELSALNEYRKKNSGDNPTDEQVSQYVMLKKCFEEKQRPYLPELNRLKDAISTYPDPEVEIRNLARARYP